SSGFFAGTGTLTVKVTSASNESGASRSMDAIPPCLVSNRVSTCRPLKSFARSMVFFGIKVSGSGDGVGVGVGVAVGNGAGGGVAAGRGAGVGAGGRGGAGVGWQN